MIRHYNCHLNFFSSIVIAIIKNITFFQLKVIMMYIRTSCKNILLRLLSSFRFLSVHSCVAFVAYSISGLRFPLQWLKIDMIKRQKMHQQLRYITQTSCLVLITYISPFQQNLSTYIYVHCSLGIKPLKLCCFG